MAACLSQGKSQEEGTWGEEGMSVLLGRAWGSTGKEHALHTWRLACGMPCSLSLTDKLPAHRSGRGAWGLRERHEDFIATKW